MNDTTIGTEERLPTFLRRRNGRLEMVLSATGLESWSKCQTQFGYSHDVGIESAAPKAAMNFGKGVHEAQAVRFKRELGRSNTTWADAGLAALEADQRTCLTAYFDSNPQPADDFRSAGRAIELVVAFNAAFPTFDWQVLGVEERFEVEVGALPFAIGSTDNAMPDQLTVPVYFRGIKDLVVAQHGGLWVVDWKTTKDWSPDRSTNRNLLAGKRKFQFRAYAWAERERQRQIGATDVRMGDRDLLPVLGTIGFWLVCRPPYVRFPAKPTPREEFYPEAFAFADWQLEEWRVSFLDKAAAILRAWSTRNYDMADGDACGFNGRCPYYDICETRPEDRQALIANGVDYQPRQRIEDVAEAATE